MTQTQKEALWQRKMAVFFFNQIIKFYESQLLLILLSIYLQFSNPSGETL
jgi:hypothetical protein